MANLGMNPGKIMLHKATEFSREAAILQRAAELQQANAQKTVSQQAELKRSSVQDVNKAEAAAITRDGGEEGRQNLEEKRKRAKKAEEKILADADVGTEKRLLDIRI